MPWRTSKPALISSSSYATIWHAWSTIPTSLNTEREFRMGFLAGKRALIVGLATERSIAHGIAAAMKREGAELAFTYQGDRLKDRVIDMAKEFGSTITMPSSLAIAWKRSVVGPGMDSAYS